MLKQEPDPQEHSAAGMRVKTEEFARAIAALEARRQAEAQQMEGTIVIGDVLQQLQINVPAEEVLQEIQAARAGQPHAAITRRPFWNAEQSANAKLVAGIVLIPLVTIVIAAMMLNPHNPPRPIATGGARDGFPLWMPPPPNIPYGVTGGAMDEGGFNASSILKPLSAVPDDQPVHCTTASVSQLFNSFTRALSLKPYTSRRPYGMLDPVALAQSSQLFDTRPNLHKPWVLIKHDNRLYLRAWVAAKFTEAQAIGHPVTLHSSWQSFDPGVQPCPITLLADFRPDITPQFGPGSGFGGLQSSVTATDVHLDKHAYEKW